MPKSSSKNFLGRHRLRRAPSEYRVILRKLPWHFPQPAPVQQPFQPQISCFGNGTFIAELERRMVNIKHILCPIGASPDSSEALRYAVALARAYQARLSVCHCAELAPQVAVSIPAPGGVMLETLLRGQFAQRHWARQRAGPEQECIVIEGDAAEAIPRFAAEQGVDLIVMRSRRRPMAAALLGSTAEAICRTAPCPVLVTHSDEREWASLERGRIDLRRILIAYDFSSDAELALSYGLSLAQEYQAELHLLHALAPALVRGAMDATEEFVSAAQRLQQAVPAEAQLWCRIKQAVKSGPAYREALVYAEDNEIDLICLGAQGAGFSMRALFGSNADRVLRQAHCPVLIARPLKPMFKEANHENPIGS